MKNYKNFKYVSTLLLTAILVFAAAGCPKVVSERKKDIAAPVLLTLSPSDGCLTVRWNDSDPNADTYDIYYRQGRFNTADEVIAGNRLYNRASPFTIAGLANGRTYSVIVSANKTGYAPVNSGVKTGRPQAPSIPGNENENENEEERDFTAPVFSIIPSADRIICEWTDSDSADSYDIYYAEGEFNTAEEIKFEGWVNYNINSPYTISGIANGTLYSIIISANRDGYETIDSEVKKGKPASVSAPAGRSKKRGVSYNFNTVSGTTWADMDLLGPGISWFYDWGHRPQTRDVENAGAAHSIEYMPMAWSDIMPNDLRGYVQAHPEAEYLLAFNEPNLISGWESAYQLPQVAAEKWVRLKETAVELGLKIVSPAMAMVGDPPIEWMDAFLSQPQVSLDDMAAIAFHAYLNGPSAFRDAVISFKKYNKPIWMTEWCAWDGGAWEYHRTEIMGSNSRPNPEPPGFNWDRWMDEVFAKEGTEFQMFYLSQTAMYMELDPWIERYAWFIPKRSGEDYTQYPWMDLLTKTNPPKLTGMGQVYINMSVCDKSIWVPRGQIIQAKDFSSNNLEEWAIHSNDGWQNSVTFRPTTDENGLSVLDIWYKNIDHGYMWAEYQVYMEEAGDRTLSLRYSAPQDASMSVYVNEKQAAAFTLSGENWQTKDDVSLGYVPAGRHTIRLRVNGGKDSNIALNWLKVD